LRRHGKYAVREANADPLRRKPCHDVRHDQDSDSDSLFALHARWFYTDWRTVRQWHANSSGARESLVHGRAAGKDVKSDCIQTGIGRFVDHSRNLRLRVAVLRRIESRRCDSRLRSRGQRDRNARARGRVQRAMTFLTRLTSHFPLKRSCMSPLLSGDRGDGVTEVN
jgi:hypothetical protein